MKALHVIAANFGPAARKLILSGHPHLLTVACRRSLAFPFTTPWLDWFAITHSSCQKPNREMHAPRPHGRGHSSPARCRRPRFQSGWLSDTFSTVTLTSFFYLFPTTCPAGWRSIVWLTWPVFTIGVCWCSITNLLRGTIARDLRDPARLGLRCQNRKIRSDSSRNWFKRSTMATASAGAGNPSLCGKPT